MASDMKHLKGIQCRLDTHPLDSLSDDRNLQGSKYASSTTMQSRYRGTVESTPPQDTRMKKTKVTSFPH